MNRLSSPLGLLAALASETSPVPETHEDAAHRATGEGGQGVEVAEERRHQDQDEKGNAKHQGKAFPLRH